MLDLLKRPNGPKQATRLAIIKALMARSATKKQLEQRTGRSEITIYNEVKALREQGIAEPAERGGSQEIRLSPLSGVAVGVELGYQHTVVIARRAHQAHDDAETEFINVGAAYGQDAWLGAAARAISAVVGRVSDGRDGLATIGMGIPRVVNPQDQTLVPPLLPPWDGSENPAVALANALAQVKHLDVPPYLRVRLDNDANLGAYAQYVYRHSRKETLIYIKASTGVGAGIMISGKLFRGAKGCAGELGHTMIQPDGRFCLCGGRGCLETLVGADSMLRDAQAMLGDKLVPRPSSATELIEEAVRGNPICRRIVRDAATQLGLAIGNLCNLFNPNVVVLGGVFGRAGDLAIEACNEGIRKTAMAATYDGSQPLVVTSELPRATAQGALLMGIDGEGQP
ncbi:ROK family transcriptional regulator [Nonomuraea diastatica]|uniref:ROK family transcriptional regulator n=1 Tax=Nonomuraea diastatica TaxID=1848329 RepID=A0A4R4X3L4_9ACTN|nr:ROK family transcriptional regulator [Nonomuraea diastatica]TDD24881.1 ROK family transcriptional regulator [Nonomuraea diastatica]